MLSFPLRESVLSYLPPKSQEEIWNTLSTKAINTRGLGKAIILELRDFIAGFGKMFTALFRQSITFIIRTVLKMTTGLKTLSAFRRKNIQTSTSIGKNKLKSYTKPEMQLQSGINPTRGVYGTLKMPYQTGLKEVDSHINAKYAKRFILAKIALETNIALNLVEVRHNIIEIRSKLCVLFADHILKHLRKKTMPELVRPYAGLYLQHE